MDILENILIRKYFGCTSIDGTFPHGNNHPCKMSMAYRVLKAMQETIKKGEKFMWFDFCAGTWTEGICPIDYDPRPDHLHLPDAHQPKAEKKDRTCACRLSFWTHTAIRCGEIEPEPVNEKLEAIIGEIARQLGDMVGKPDHTDGSTMWFKDALTKLVALARQK